VKRRTGVREAGVGSYREIGGIVILTRWTSSREWEGEGIQEKERGAS